MAFGSTAAREEAFEAAEWERRVAAAAAGERQVTFVVAPEGAASADGLAVGMLDDDDPTVAHLFSMWVAPEGRGAGTGRELVDAVVGWAVERGARRLETTVAEGNAAAAALYAAAGFADTGRREPLGHSDGMVAVLERRLP
jgi:ribosomal protein S18 acetylase RimI-like enzyme